MLLTIVSENFSLMKYFFDLFHYEKSDNHSDLITDSVGVKQFFDFVVEVATVVFDSVVEDNYRGYLSCC